MKKAMLLAMVCAVMAACGGNSSNQEKNPFVQDGGSQGKDGANPSYDPNRGTGKFTHVDISPNLDASKAESGQKIFDVKCNACHKLTSEKLVGPGWKEVTKRHGPEWIMNFVTNTDEMISKDPKAQAQLEICLVRMPNQNLTDDDARNIYEFMRKNDGVK